MESSIFAGRALQSLEALGERIWHGQKKLPLASSVFIAWMMSKSASIADEKTIERGFFGETETGNLPIWKTSFLCNLCLTWGNLWLEASVEPGLGSNPSMRPQVAAVDLASSQWVEQFNGM